MLLHQHVEIFIKQSSQFVCMARSTVRTEWIVSSDNSLQEVGVILWDYLIWKMLLIRGNVFTQVPKICLSQMLLYFQRGQFSKRFTIVNYNVMTGSLPRVQCQCCNLRLRLANGQSTYKLTEMKTFKKKHPQPVYFRLFYLSYHLKLLLHAEIQTADL